MIITPGCAKRSHTYCGASSLERWPLVQARRTSRRADAPSADSTDPAVSRFLDAVWMERGPLAQHARRLSRRPHRARALARRTRRADHEDHARGPAGFHRVPRAGGRPAALHRAPAFQLPPLLPLPAARGRDQGRPDRADRDAEDRPLAAEVAHRRGSRIAARRAGRERSARQPRSHACSRCCTPRACASRSS